MPSLRNRSAFPVLPLAVALGVALMGAPASAASLSQPAGTGGCVGSAAQSCAKGIGLGGLEKAVVSPDGKNLYAVANDGEWGALLVFSRNTGTGALAQLAGTAGCLSFDGRTGASDARPASCAQHRRLARATDVAVSSDGLTVYTLGSDSFIEAIGVWRRDPATGALSALQCVTAEASEGCATAEFIEPDAFVLSPDNRFLTVGGGSLSSLPVNADGTLGSGTCFFRLARGTAGARTACAGAPVYAPKMTISSLEGTGTRIFAAVDGFNAPSGSGRSLARFERDATTGALTTGACSGTPPATGATCAAMRVFGFPFELAISPLGDGVYTAGYDFVETDEEQGTGYVRASALSAFGAGLRQLPGKKGCVLFTGRTNAGCAQRPAAHGRGFSRASGVAVTPDGAHALGGFRGAVALLRRNPKTQQLTPIKGRSACVDVRSASIARCRAGRALGGPVSFAFAPNGATAYAISSGGIATLRLGA